MRLTAAQLEGGAQQRHERGEHQALVERQVSPGQLVAQRRRRRRRRRLRLPEHLPSGWACRRSVYPGQGALREEGQRQGGPSPGILPLRLGSSRGLVPQRGARAEGETRGDPGPPARRAAPRPPSPPPGAGARVPGGRGGAGSLGSAGLS